MFPGSTFPFPFRRATVKNTYSENYFLNYVIISVCLGEALHMCIWTKTWKQLRNPVWWLPCILMIKKGNKALKECQHVLKKMKIVFKKRITQTLIDFINYIYSIKVFWISKRKGSSVIFPRHLICDTFTSY